MRGLLYNSTRIALLLTACAAASALPAAPAAAQTAYSPYAETPAAALARYVRTLASTPRDFSSLIGAGRAALALGDTHAAAGFFGRADEVNPNSPLPHAGMGAVSVANGEPSEAFPHFARAQQLGAPLATFGADRGLAYDLLGQQAQAQSDYSAALVGPDADEARRRLALSLAISGKKAEALEALAPLQARRDSSAGRVRAFVLALSGDSNGAMVAFDAAMPGSWARVAPFLKQLPALAAGQKAAAVNLGIFPDMGGTAFASAVPQPSSGVPATSRGVATMPADRLASVDQLFSAPAPAQMPAPQRSSVLTTPQTQLAYAHPVQRQAAPPENRQAAAMSRKLWLQLASGHNAEALPVQFRRMKSRNRDLFDGIKGFVAKSPDRARLVIGPFRGTSDAQTFAQDLESVGIDAFSWTNSESDTLVPLGME